MKTVFLGVTLALTFFSEAASEFYCQNIIHCSCGSSNATYKFCSHEQLASPNLCDLLSKCSKCENYKERCIECPDGLEGEFCLKETRTKRQTGNVFNKRNTAVRKTRQIREDAEDQSGGTFAFCRDPGIDPNGDRTPKRSKYRYGFRQGTRLEYSCKDEFELRGEKSLYCRNSGEWSAPIPTCHSINGSQDISSNGKTESCINPGSLKNGEVSVIPSDASRATVDDFDFPADTRFQYSCNDGYTLEGSSSIKCTSSGVWSDRPPVCLRAEGGTAYCNSPGRIRNGRVSIFPAMDQRNRVSPAPDLDDPDFPAGTRLQYSCKAGFILQGPSTLRCRSSGSWSGFPPVCKSETQEGNVCENPGPINHGKVGRLQEFDGALVAKEDDDPNYPAGTRLQYTCEENYLLDGPSILVCQESGAWSDTPPECISECGHSFIRISHRVVNGTKSKLGEWPWIVALSIKRGSHSALVCGGAIINPTTVITAAHCIVTEKFTLHFGKVFVSEASDDSGVVKRSSSRIIVHSKYNRTNFNADIAIIKFEPRIRYNERIQPLCLPTEESTSFNLQNGMQGYVTGFGINEHFVQTTELMHTELPIRSNDICKNSYRRLGFNIHFTENMFCAGLDEGQRGACDGDSGSPFTFYDSNRNKYILEGLVSFTTKGQCAAPGKYTVFTKVYKFLPWIFRNM